MGAPQKSPPAEDELEVSVFGPGRGECIVVRLPGGPWFIVDSLRVGGEPVAVTYLRELGVTDVYGLFVTHWHSDHSAGAAQVVAAFEDSLRVVGLPGGWNERELAAFTGALLGEDLTGATGSVVRDLVALMSCLKERDGIKKVLLVDGQSLAPERASWSLTALSPSSDDVARQASTLLRFLPGYSGPAPTEHDVNSACAVLQLRIGDLTVGRTATEGWRAIIKYRGAALASQIVKVGHHGSETAFLDEAWAAFGARARPDAVITPFPARSGRIPRETMLDRLAKVSDRLYLTAIAKHTARVGGVRLADTPFRAFVPTSASTLANVGHVRFRGLPGQRATVDCFGPSVQISRIVVEDEPASPTPAARAGRRTKPAAAPRKRKSG